MLCTLNTCYICSPPPILECFNTVEGELPLWWIIILGGGGLIITISRLSLLTFPDFSLSGSTPPPPSEGLQPLNEDMQDGQPSGQGLKLAPHPALASTSSFCKRKRNDPYRISSIIKLEYDLSNPVYLKVKDLILTYVIRWFLLNSEQLRDTAEVSLFCPPPPTILPPQELQGPSGAKLLRAMWFTTRDNVNLLLEICRQGFSSSTPPSLTRQLVDLYRIWYQVRQSVNLS